MGASTFEDLLPEGSPFTKKEDEPKTIGEMKKKTIAEETDPTKLKVRTRSEYICAFLNKLDLDCLEEIYGFLKYKCFFSQCCIRLL